MKKTLLILLLFGFMLAAAQEKITKPVGNFSEIKVFDGISATLIKSNENKIVISGEDAAKVAFVNTNGKLKIRMKMDNLFNGHKTFAEVYYTDVLEIIDANENAYISSSETIKQIAIVLKAQEGGEIAINVEVQKLTLKSFTGGRIALTGTSKTQDITLNTGGQYEGDSLKTEQTTVDVSAGGKAYVNASEYVKAKVSAGGTIRIYGNPKVIDKQTFLGGRIIEY
jgi:Putative auto-transporter adhesin, head GIN domain